jgi:uncharacterized protein
LFAFNVRASQRLAASRTAEIGSFDSRLPALRPDWRREMKWKLLTEDRGSRTFALVFEPGETVMQPLLAFLEEEVVTAARLTGIGALQSVTLGYFDWETKEIVRNEFHEQVELLSLAGDVAVKDSEPQVHAHVVLGRRDNSTLGGHLVDATVRPTLELIIEDAPVELRKTVDAESGLALINPEA